MICRYVKARKSHRHGKLAHSHALKALKVEVFPIAVVAAPARGSITKMTWCLPWNLQMHSRARHGRSGKRQVHWNVLVKNCHTCEDDFEYK